MLYLNVNVKNLTVEAAYVIFILVEIHTNNLGRVKVGWIVNKPIGCWKGRYSHPISLGGAMAAYGFIIF